MKDAKITFVAIQATIIVMLILCAQLHGADKAACIHSGAPLHD